MVVTCNECQKNYPTEKCVFEHLHYDSGCILTVKQGNGKVYGDEFDFCSVETGEVEPIDGVLTCKLEDESERATKPHLKCEDGERGKSSVLLSEKKLHVNRKSIAHINKISVKSDVVAEHLFEETGDRYICLPSPIETKPSFPNQQENNLLVKPESVASQLPEETGDTDHKISFELPTHTENNLSLNRSKPIVYKRRQKNIPVESEVVASQHPKDAEKKYHGSKIASQPPTIIKPSFKTIKPVNHTTNKSNTSVEPGLDALQLPEESGDTGPKNSFDLPTATDNYLSLNRSKHIVYSRRRKNMPIEPEVVASQLSEKADDKGHDSNIPTQMSTQTKPFFETIEPDVHTECRSNVLKFSEEMKDKEFARTKQSDPSENLQGGDPGEQGPSAVDALERTEITKRRVKRSVGQGKEDHVCEVCEKRFTTHNRKLIHKSRHTGEKPHVCKFCNNKFTSKSHLKDHEGVHTGANPYSCEVCGREFARNSERAQHLRSHTREKPYFCEVCDKNFALKRSKVLHMQLHTGEKPYGCNLCSSRFTRRGRMLTHMRVHTGEKPYVCGVCDKGFALKVQKATHMKIHTGEKPYSCELCDRKFTQHSYKIQHMKTHTGKKPYSCEVCEKSFAHNCSKVKHMRIHTGEKPYQCTLCSRSFTHQYSMLRHMRGHTGEKLYQCSLCSRSFTHRSSMLRHMGVHTGGKPYVCDVCDKRFAVRTHMTDHMRLHTGKKS